jgi:MtrB/PioB family decaheme-associated outer membrane protein
MTGSARLALPALLLAAPLALAQEPPQEPAPEPAPAADPATGTDTVPAATRGDAPAAAEAKRAAPECQFCPAPPADEGILQGGLGHVSGDAYRFGNYRGFDETGVVGVLGGSWRHRGDDARYLDLSLENLLLDTRALALDAGQQGRYELRLGYDAIPQRSVDTGRSPFRGIGGGTLTLPPGWVRSGTTGGMTQLRPSLRPVELGQDRTRWHAGADWLPASGWRLGADYRHDTREGLRGQGGSFLTRATILPAPIDYTHDHLGLRVSRSGPGSFAELAYAASQFRNGEDWLLWDNPYAAQSAGADRGRLALAPDNEFQQVALATGWRLPGTFTAGVRLAAGVGEQDETYVPVTENPNLAAAPARASLGGEVRKLGGQARVSGALHPRVRQNAEYLFDERENRTPRAVYTPVVTDVFAGAPETNTPYSFERQTLKLRSDVRLTRAWRLAAGAERDERDRTFQQRRQTTEDRLWVRASARLPFETEASARYAHAARDGGNVQAVPEVDPPENPAMRQFHLADRDRDEVQLRASVSALAWLGVVLDLRVADDAYEASPLGLQDGSERHFGVSASSTWQELVLHATAAETRTDAALANSAGGARWTGSNEDVTRSVAVGATSEVGPVRYGTELAFVRSAGAIAVDRGVAGDPAFPHLHSELHSLRVFAGMPVRPRLRVRADYVYERFEHTDWALDRVAPDAIANVLSLGQGTPGYEAHAVLAWLELSFGGETAGADAAE